MKTPEYLFVTLTCAVAFTGISAVPPASAAETQAESPATQRNTVAEVTSAQGVALPATPTAVDASRRDRDEIDNDGSDGDASDQAEPDTRRWPDEDDEPEDR